MITLAHRDLDSKELKTRVKILIGNSNSVMAVLIMCFRNS